MKPRPKKHLGQHFLTEVRIAQRIAELLQPTPEETIIEIGPGKGVLTQYLVEKPNPVLAIELDSESVDYLPTQLRRPNLIILEADFLTVKLPNKPLVLSGNLPYNISSPIFFRLLDERELIREAVVMIQKEVAQRICAEPGNKIYGILSVLLGYYYERKLAFTVKPGVFFPPPKVDSAVIRLTRKENLPPLNLERFKQIVKTAFGQRRKTLSNALKELQIELPENLKGLRAEQLSVEQFAQLARDND